MTINDNFLIINTFNAKDSNFTSRNDLFAKKLTVMEDVKQTAKGGEGTAAEKGYLLAYDKKEQKVKGVKGIAANGDLETIEANEQNKGDFIRVDRFGNFFTNFGKNFMYQYNHPTRFSLYRMPEDTPVEQAARKIEEAQLPQNESIRRELSRENRIYNNHLFNEREINWEQAARYGITPELLRQTGDMERMLQGRQSGRAFEISMNTELGRQNGDAKLSLFRDENGVAKFDLHFIRQAPKVGQEYRGYKIEEDVLEALNRTGNAGRTIDLVVDYRTGETKPCYLSKDMVTNEMFFLPADQARCPRKIKDYTLSDSEYADYVAGKEVPIVFKSVNGKICNTSIQMSAAERGTEFLWERSTRKPEKKQGVETEKAANPTKKPSKRTKTSVTPKM